MAGNIHAVEDLHREAVDELDGPAFLRLEAAAIIEAADRIDAGAFARAIDLLDSRRGKIVVSGIGTSGIIARKIAATLTSTGASAVFLHPADALHGGLGVLEADDVGIFLSNSGETDEMLVLLPHFESRGVPFVAIVGKLTSTLARRSAVALDAHVGREACPLDLAPTASASVALAIGDALAMALMRRRGFTPEQFAYNHPSGQLGKRLTLRVDDLMHSGELRPVVRSDATWAEVVGAVTAGGLGAVAVVDDESFQGIITDGDLRRTVQRVDVAALEDQRAKELMTPDPVCVAVGTLAYDAVRLMEDRPSPIGVLPVVDAEGACVGFVRLHDLVRSGLR